MKKELWWLVAILVIVALAARLLGRPGADDSHVVWTERWGPDRVVTVEICGDRVRGGRVHARATCGEGSCATLDQPVSASEMAVLLDTLSAAGAWTLDSEIYDPGRSPHNDLLMEEAGRRHETCFESRFTPAHAVLDEAVDHSCIGRIMGQLRGEGRRADPRFQRIPPIIYTRPLDPNRPPERDPHRDPGRDPNRPPERDPRRDPGRDPNRPPERDPRRDPGRDPNRPPERDPGRRLYELKF
jgi:hypothetical protein